MAKPNQPPPGSGDQPFLSSDFSRDVLQSLDLAFRVADLYRPFARP